MEFLLTLIRHPERITKKLNMLPGGNQKNIFIFKYIRNTLRIAIEFTWRTRGLNFNE